MSTASQLFNPGEVINDRFEVLSILGGGGFATVYKVFDSLENEYWALKLFRATAADESLKREIAALRKIQHPNVLQIVWGDKTPDGRRFLLTELLEGETLDQYVGGENELPDKAIVQIGLELLDGLAAIHPDDERIRELEGEDLSQETWDELQALKERGFVHRDIKPSNLMLTHQGLKIMDFNIASRVGDRVFTTSGTAAYMPPDVDLTRWTTTTDLFAAGVTLYELLCRAHPYEGADTLAGRGPIDPFRFRSDLPAELTAFLQKACAKTTEARFVTAKEMKRGWEAATRDLRPPQPEQTAVRTDAAPARPPRIRNHEVHEGSLDLLETWTDEIDWLRRMGAGWPAVLTCGRDSGVWPTFGEREDLEGRLDLLDICVTVVRRERPGGGRFQLSDEGVYVWALGRQVVRFVRRDGGTM
jgi:serine/threonine protein kinase